MPTTDGCYAAALEDCDGGPLTREHYISKNVLEQFGGRFAIEGASWASAPRWVSPSSLTGHILCQQHNNLLSDLDSQAGALHRILRAAHDSDDAGDAQFDGEVLERWALKVLLGLLASGTLFGTEGREMPIPLGWLRVLFGHAAVPVGCGFFYVGDPVEGMDADLLSVACNRFPQGHEEAGNIFGITLQFPGFRFLTCPFLRLEANKQRLVHRPDGFPAWPSTSSTNWAPMEWRAGWWQCARAFDATTTVATRPKIAVSANYSVESSRPGSNKVRRTARSAIMNTRPGVNVAAFTFA